MRSVRVEIPNENGRPPYRHPIEIDEWERGWDGAEPRAMPDPLPQPPSPTPWTGEQTAMSWRTPDDSEIFIEREAMQRDDGEAFAYIDDRFDY